MRRGVETKRRRDSVTARVYEKLLREVILMHRERVLPVTAEICEIWGGLGASGQINPVDALIAATAVCYNFTLATRNTRDFQRCGVDYINPFEA
jgi:predicted nucleic acid-binding protein